MPQRALSKNTYIGDFVFATSNKAYAAMYLAPKGRAMLLNTFHGVPSLVVSGSVEEFLNADKGGAIYEIPPDSFADTPQTELANTELVSSVPVVPLRKEIFDTSLQALRQMNVPVYFVDDALFDTIKDADDHGRAVLQGLEPYDLSEY